MTRQDSRKSPGTLTGLEIAVIGMAGKFPGAKNIDEFWDNLKRGKETITFFSDRELEKAGVDPGLIKSRDYVKTKPLLEERDCFDSSFFGYTPREAEIMVPHVRLFYECTWWALEDAGYDPTAYNGLIGCYAGASSGFFWQESSIISGKNDELGKLSAGFLSDKDTLSTRMAYKLDLKGPCLSVNTACSTSLVAIHLACRALLTGECEIALAGGAALNTADEIGYMYEDGNIYSADGHCKAFDARTNGTNFGEGVGTVVLKRFHDAVNDRDHIYAVIKGSAINNDGTAKIGFSAPAVLGQKEVVKLAHRVAGVEPGSISYVEAHGTGTPMGDPVEIEALKQAFNTDKKQFCALGSVKTNVGHLDVAAGITGFIKAVLALKYRLIPPSLHFEIPNPAIDFENSPFYVNTGLKEWKSEIYPLRAGVSAFGIGGTNAHIVLEEALRPVIGDSSLPTGETGKEREHQLILLSAKTPSALDKMTLNLAGYFKKNLLNRGNHENSIDPGPTLADAAYTLQVGRKAFKHRKVLVVSNINETVRLLESSNDPSAGDFSRTRTARSREKNRLVFMFPGQGSQYVNMGRDLYRTERVFREEIDLCFEMLKSLMDDDIKEILYPGDLVSEESSSVSPVAKKSPANCNLNLTIDDTQIAQPLLFIFEYALAKLLMKWGIEPYAMMGHSIGEYVAACLSGVFSLEDALKAVTLRGKLMQQMPPGAMLSISLSEEELKPLVAQNPDLALAAVNAPRFCVVSGPYDAVNVFENQLKRSGHDYKRLHTSHAFHSSMMDPILKPFEDVLKEIKLNKPRLPYISNVTGKWITVEQAVSPRYWSFHLRTCVRFAHGLALLLKEPGSIFIEVGPGRSLSTLARKHTGKKNGHVIINLVKAPKDEAPDGYYLLNNISQLWLYGEKIDWSGFYRDEKRRRIPLPGYPFEGKPYWLKTPSGKHSTGVVSKPHQEGKRSDIARWFYVPSWKRSMIPIRQPNPTPPPFNWLIFMDEMVEANEKGERSIGEKLQEQLEQEAHDNTGTFTVVRRGTAFNGGEDDQYTVNPRQPGDYRALIAQLKKQRRTPNRIVHLWTVTGTGNHNHIHPGIESDEKYEDLGFYSLIYLAQAIGKEEINGNIDLMVVTDHMQEVSGNEQLNPRKAALLGPVMVIPTEYPNISCRSIDVVIPRPGTEEEKKLIRQLAAELCAESPDNVVAYRNHYRLVQTYEPMRFEALNKEAPPIRLKKNGVYLITGGLGGIGSVIAGHLAETVGARLILTARSSFLRREEWEPWLNTHDTRDKVSTGIRKIQGFEKAGARVMVFCADVSDYRRMQAIIAGAEAELGVINGVIHAAGLPGGGMIQMKTREQADKVMAPKVKGTLVLNRVLKDHPLDFFVLCSSIGAIIPRLGQVDYYAANAFMDAFAYYKTAVDGIFTVSINWDTWQEVGMAVEAVKQSKPGRQWEFQGREIQHPLFRRCIHQDQNQAIFITTFNFNKHWVLNEHKLANSGNGLVPGVTYLEMAREAFVNYLENEKHETGIIEISDVHFLNVLMVGENQEREARLLLKKQSHHFDFMVQGRHAPGNDNWQTHAVGKLKIAEVDEKPGKHEIKEIQKRCNENFKTGGDSPGDLLVFGPRWEVFKQVQYGDNQGLASLQLNEAFIGDFDFYKLHPALLDMATSFLSGYVSKGVYIPFSYKCLRMYDPLPAKIYSYSRLIETKEAAPGKTLKFDVTIMDPQGSVLVDIKEFIIREVTGGLKARLQEKANGASHLVPVDSLHTEAKAGQIESLENGILPPEGIEVFNRILAGTLPQIVVSTTSLTDRSKNAVDPSALLQMEKLEEEKSPTPMHSRPELVSPYAAPKTNTERLVADIWQNFLGIDPIGIHDNFFELGGDSLNIVKLNGLLKKALNRDIPISVMFGHLTIHSFALYLDQEKSGEAAARETPELLDDIKKSKQRMKSIKKRDEVLK